MRNEYINLKIPAPQRLAILRRHAREWNAKHPRAPLQSPTWREVRFATLAQPRGLSQGFNEVGRNRVPVWVTHDGPAFNRERFADEVINLRHTGWYTDSECMNGTYRGLVAYLSRGRWLAGYYSSDNGERVYFHGVHDSERDAAHMADEHARVSAERESEYQDRYRAAQELQDGISLDSYRLRECLALRNHKCFEGMRAEIAELIESIRDARDNLARNYSGVL